VELSARCVVAPTTRRTHGQDLTQRAGKDVKSAMHGRQKVPKRKAAKKKSRR
jgi:hypothetical protein